MKKVILAFIFIIIGLVIFLKCESIIKSNNEGGGGNAREYYELRSNIDIDVFLLGTSRIYFSLSPMDVWNKYGVISYNMGSSGQYYKISYLFLEEIFSKHSPKVVVFGIDRLLDAQLFDQLIQVNDRQQNWIKLALANMENSFFKLYAYNYIYDNISLTLENMNTMNIFHTRWKELRKYDFSYENFWKGKYAGSYIGTRWHTAHLINKQNKYENNNITPGSLDPETIEYANKMVDLAEKHNSKILFISMPYITNKANLEKYLAFEIYAKAKGWDYINYNLLYDEINLDFNRDFRDWDHLNLYGGRKVMDHLIPYVIEKYNVPIRKGDPKYASWDADYIKYARAVNREEIRELTSFSEWQGQAFYDNYTLLISTNGDNVLNRLSDNMKNLFTSLGLNKFETEEKNQKYIAIIDNNEAFYEEVSSEKAEYKRRMKNIVNLLVSSENKKATINVSGKGRSKNRYGINFVIYDKVNREIVDSIWVDPAKPDVVRR